MANERILSNVEKEFMISALELGLRTDGRHLDTVREMKIGFGSKTGSIEISLGKTRVLARMSHELGSPRGDKPNEGTININCTFPNYYHSVTNDTIDRICLIIKAGIYESKAIDLESLCILNGDKVWILTCDISVIQHDGNIIDCANLAALCALKHHRRPDVTVVGSKISVHSMLDRHPVALAIHHLPICVTLAHVLVKDTSNDEDDDEDEQRRRRSNKNTDGFYTFIDPNRAEEKLMNGKTVYCMTKHNQLCAVDKIGGVAMSAKSFLQFIDGFVMDIVKKWSNQIENKFIQYRYQQEDALQRKLRLNKKVTNPIDVFGFGTQSEAKESKQNNDNEDDDLLMGDADEDKLWTQWENQEKMKLQSIQTHLKQSLSEKRVSVRKSILTSEFE